MTPHESRPLHEILWDGATHMSRPAETGDAPLPVAVMGALMLTHSALEAYINHVGARAVPEVWADEKAHFTATPHRGVLGKLNWLCERLEVAQDWSTRPWQALKALDSWRNRLAHGKDDDGAPGDLLDACTPADLATSRDAVREVCGRLHAAAAERYELAGDAARAPFDGIDDGKET